MCSGAPTTVQGPGGTRCQRSNLGMARLSRFVEALGMSGVADPKAGSSKEK